MRECAQNSLDAAIDPAQPKIIVRIERVSLERTDLPFVGSLEDTLHACARYWHAHSKARQFFAKALAAAGSQHIDAIRISDFGTTGVDGSDDDNTGRWFGLVKSRGVSNQEGDESGGAFGIGKDAPLAGSQFRTVLYSTRTRDGHTAFQGVCRLVTHKDRNGELTQGTGFIGDFDAGEKLSRALRNPDAIPECFRRTEPGLDVWILGSRHSEDDWSEPFIRSALANFWPAIADNKITFEVGDKTIDAATLGNGMRTHRLDDQVADELPFYRALVDQHAKQLNAQAASRERVPASRTHRRTRPPKESPNGAANRNGDRHVSSARWFSAVCRVVHMRRTRRQSSASVP